MQYPSSSSTSISQRRFELIVPLLLDVYYWFLSRFSWKKGCLNLTQPTLNYSHRQTEQTGSCIPQYFTRYKGFLVDLQFQRYFSWRPNPSAETTNAFLEVWTHIKGYANPRWNLDSPRCRHHSGGGSCVEIPTMVPYTLTDASRLSEADNRETTRTTLLQRSTAF